MSNWINLKAVKNEALMEMVIFRYGLKLIKANSTQLRGRCALPCHKSKNSKYSFAVNFYSSLGS